MGDISFTLGHRPEPPAEDFGDLKRDVRDIKENPPGLIHMKPRSFAEGFGPSSRGSGVGNAIS